LAWANLLFNIVTLALQCRRLPPTLRFVAAAAVQFLGNFLARRCSLPQRCPRSRTHKWHHSWAKLQSTRTIGLNLHHLECSHQRRALIVFTAVIDYLQKVATRYVSATRILL
jgi:hypothetical protein